MKKIKLLGLLAGALALSGCMATIRPDGTVSASYIVPQVSGVVITHHHTRPVIAHRPHPRPFYHTRDMHRPNNGYRPNNGRHRPR